MAKPRPHASRTAARTRLRRLLVREGSYAAIASAAASGELRDVLPTRIFSHIGDVYGRLELAAGPDFPDIAVLRLMVLVHEERPARTRVLLEDAGVAEAAPAVAAILNGFGEVWRAASDEQLREYTLVHASCLPGAAAPLRARPRGQGDGPDEARGALRRDRADVPALGAAAQDARPLARHVLR